MDHGQAGALSCPFCSFTDSDAYFLTQHVELCHPENGRSPFIAEQEEGAESLATETNAGEYLNCPRGCGESILAADLPSHLNLHAAEDIALEDEETEVEQFEDTPVEFQRESSRGMEHFDEQPSIHMHKGRSRVRHRHEDSGRNGFHANTSLSTVHGGKTKRLGVMPSRNTCSSELLTASLAFRARAPCAREADALVAS